MSFIQFARLQAGALPSEHVGSVSLRAAPVPTAAVLLVAVIAPFEIPLFGSGAGFTITTVEAASLLAVSVALAAAIVSGTALHWRTPVTWAAVACLAAFALAALLAPADRANALKFVGRMAAAGAVCLITLNAITTRARARLIVGLLLAIGVVISLLAVLEAAEVRSVLAGLTVFRPGFHVVGGQLRATSTLLYPTIASMYLEIVFALGLWLLLDPPERSRRAASLSRWRPRPHTAIVLAALATVGAGITATFTRAGLLGMAAALLLVAVLRYSKTRRIDRGHLALLALGVILVVLVLLSRSPDLLLTRFRTDGSQDWYGATYSAPATLRLQTGGEYQVPVTIENTGRLVWDSTSGPLFLMSYHWLRADTGGVVQFDGWRTPFPAPVDPHTRITMPVNVKAPGEPGRYVLVWDVVHEHRAWLSTEGVPPARTDVDVTGDHVAAAATTMARLPGTSVRPDRLTLWRSALRMTADHPVTGVGPDNYRLTYGRYLGLATWDTRVHANNMYLEVLAGAGIIGLAAFLWLAAAGSIALARQWHRASPAASHLPAAVCAAGLVIAGHGLVDSFLGFTTTYVMFALAAGLALSPAARVSKASHADRV